MGKRGPTSHDIANAAGVSQTAVSLVLRGKADGNISAENQQKIRNAAEELGYRPNRLARELRSGRATSIGLLIPDVTDPFFASVLRGAQHAATVDGYSMVMLEGALDADWEARAFEAIQSRMVASVLVCAPRGWSEADSGDLRPRIVVVDPGREVDYPAVHIDVADGMRQIAEHLRELGHRRIGRLRAGIPTDTFALRDGAFAKHAGQWSDITAVDAEAYSLAAAENAAGRLLDTGSVTAIVADTDLLAAGVYRAAKARGTLIGKDLSVTGFDDLDVARMLDPELTTVRIDGRRAGRLGVQLVLGSLDAGTAGTRLSIEAPLVVRESTGPVA